MRAATLLLVAGLLAAGCGPTGPVPSGSPGAGGAETGETLAAEARGPERATVGQAVELEGSARTGKGAPAEAPAWRWSQRLGPPVALEGADRGRARFTPIYPGRYVFALVVEAAGRASAPAFVTVKVADLEAEAAGDAAQGVRLDLRGADLMRLVEDFPGATGLVLRVSSATLRPERFGRQRIDLVLEGAPRRIAIEFAARAAGMRYRFDTAESVWLARDYAWLDDLRREASIYAVSRVATEAERARAVAALMRDLVKPCLMPGSGCTFVYDERRRSASAVLPASAHARCRRLLALLSAPAGRLAEPPPEGEPERAARAKLAAEVESDGKPRPVREALWHLAGLAGVPIAFAPPPRAAEVVLPEGRLALGEALRLVEEAAGYRGHAVLAGGGVWVHAGAAAPVPTAEFAWDAATVEVYPLGELLARGYKGPLVEHLVRRRVHPDAWLDYDGALSYLPGVAGSPLEAERLVVCHVPAVQREVARFLRHLAEHPEDSILEPGSEEGKRREPAAP